MQKRKRNKTNPHGDSGRFHCGHCNTFLSKSQYYEHKRMFWDSNTGKWKTLQDLIGETDIPGSSSSDDYEDDISESSQAAIDPQNSGAGPSSSTCSVSDMPAINPDDETGILSDHDESSHSHGIESSSEESSSSEEETDDQQEFFENIASDAVLDGDECPLPEPPEQSNRVRSILLWILYFVLVWQYCYLISDNALLMLLRFLKAFLTCIGTILQNGAGAEFIVSLATMVPTTMYSLRSLLRIDRDNFEKSVVCPKCTKLFRPEDCSVRVGNEVRAKLCDNILFPRSKRRKPCGSNLVRKVILKNGTFKFYPLKVYCYKSVIDTLECFLKRPNFEQVCEQWREREVKEDQYNDVYDGKVWKSFLRWKDREFLSLPRSYGLMLNVDWFQPFKRRKDISVGVLYMVLMNLPRAERFKRRNVIIVGVIPALSKEPASLNNFLAPLIDELNVLWKGLRVKTYLSPEEGAEIRAALICCAADIPAARKLCGFMGHSSNYGCSHCEKFFPGGFGEKKDYSGFDRNNWPKKSDAAHRKNALKILKCKTKTNRRRLESKLGTKYTSLLELPYYGSITMCIIDPMHNLFLGTAKKMFKLWCENDVLTKNHLKKVEERINSVEAPSDLGRLPGNISSNCGGFTASQWKNWVLYYSAYASEGILSEAHMHCWQNFVLACRYLCRSSITKTDLLIADRKLLDFCKNVETLYGKKVITPNMHLHLHLKDCIENYGSVYGFWLFSFERYNGLLGSFSTNNRDIEVQLMRKFLTMSSLDDLHFSMPDSFRDVFQPLCDDIQDVEQVAEEAPTPSQLMSLALAFSGPLTTNIDLWSDLSMMELPDRYRLCAFDSDDLSLLKGTYATLYPQIDLAACHVNLTVKKYQSVCVAGERLSSGLESRLYKHARIMATWAGEEGEIALRGCKPGRVKFFFEHSLQLENNHYTHCFAAVQWFKEYDIETCFRNPLSVYYAKVFKQPGPATFIPVQRIQSRFIAVHDKHQNVDILIVCPVVKNTYL